jgi:hypothetical protein
MKFLKSFIGLYLFNIYFLNLTAQEHRFVPYNVYDDISFQNALDSIIEKKYFYVDTTKIVKIRFVLKIDSTGEIHSAHIYKADNILNDFFVYQFICREIENNISVKFLFDDMKNTTNSTKFLFNLVNRKYLLIQYTYQNST